MKRGSKPVRPRRTAGIGARNEAKILKAATHVFARKGFDGARITEIAKRAGLPHPNVYYYFATKEDIYRRLVATVIHDWDRALEVIAPDSEPVAAIAAYVRAKFAHARANSLETRLFTAEVMSGAHYLPPSSRAHMRAITTRYAAVIDGWIAQGKIAPVDSRHFLVMIWATSEFYAFLEPLVCDALLTRKLKQEDFSRGAEALVSLLTRALAV